MRSRIKSTAFFGVYDPYRFWVQGLYVPLEYFPVENHVETEMEVWIPGVDGEQG